MEQNREYFKLVQTPELDVVRAVILKNDQEDVEVLLVKEVDDENWKLPGGKTHEGETIFQSLVRELEEELGIVIDEVNIKKYVSAPIPDSNNIRHIFLIKGILEGDLRPTQEVAEAGFFNLEDLPETKFKKHISSASEIILGI